MSIALAIIEIANDEIKKANASRVNEVEIDVGSISGVETTALEFALETAVKGTILENASRKINRIEAQARCMECGNEFRMPDFYNPCPNCNSFITDIYRGKELRVKSINID
jgi:hydrogenase nickel incorporation protein HypA/HybF